jgi:hypothetical protein
MFTELKKIPLLSILQFAIFILQLLLFSCSCSKSTTDPPPPPPGADTTSHNFTWQIDTFGVISSYLLDVAIINENDIWAVGEIQTDPTGVSDIYNAIHWNGQVWELIRIPVKIFNTNSFIIGRLQAVYGFSPNDVWVTTGGEVIRYNGQTWGEWEFLFDDLNDTTFGGVNKFWGSTASDLWGVGNKGNIFHYTGNSWQKIESGTSVDIQDIWGAENPQSGEYEILAVASFGPFIPQAKQLLSIQGTTVTTIPDSGLALSLSGIWFVPGEIYYVVGDGVFYAEEIGQFWQSDTTHPLLYKVAMRGNAANDIFITGSFGLVSHYNGSNWYHYRGNELPNISGGYGRVSLKLNCLTAVGRIGDQAIILRGIRN